MKRIISFQIFILFTIVAFGQETKVVESEETIEEESFSKLLGTYNKIIRADKEETLLLKFDLFGPLLFGLSNVDPEIDSVENNLIGFAIEKKYKPNWSWIFASSVRANEIELTRLRFSGGIRYYYNLNSRILEGLSANNFSANYVSISFSTELKPVRLDEQFSFHFLYGLQRRLWKYGYIDVNIGFENVISPFEGEKFRVDFSSELTLGIAIPIKTN